MCVDHTMGITTIPKNGMLGVTELSYYFWYDIHTSFFTVYILCSSLGHVFMHCLTHAGDCTNHPRAQGAYENSYSQLDDCEMRPSGLTNASSGEDVFPQGTTFAKSHLKTYKLCTCMWRFLSLFQACRCCIPLSSSHMHDS